MNQLIHRPTPDPTRTAPHQALITVALCTYNGERFLREQVESLLAQTYSPLEILAVDDASNDATVEILAEYAQRDSRVRYLCNHQNLGFRGNFNKALRLARGELIALCDQDDVWLPEKLAVLAAALHEHEALLAHCNSELIDPHGQSLGPRILDPAVAAHYDHPIPILFRTVCSGHATLLRRSLLDQALPIPATMYHDWWLAFAAASAGRVVYVDRCLVRYRRHPDSVVFIEQQAPQDRRPGFRRRELDEIKQRLMLFAAHPGREQAFFRKLLALWRRRESSILSLRLCLLMLRYRHQLFCEEPPLQQVRLALKFFWGLRFKRWLEPRRYAC